MSVSAKQFNTQFTEPFSFLMCSAQVFVQLCIHFVLIWVFGLLQTGNLALALPPAGGFGTPRYLRIGVEKLTKVALICC